MNIYKFRPDMVFDGVIEVPDDTKVIPKYHTFQSPPEIPEGYYAIMRGGWRLIEGVVPIYPTPPTPEEIATAIFKEISDKAQLRLDNFAKTKNYDGILSACTYVTSVVDKFRIEGQYAVNIRDLTWDVLYKLLDDVIAGIIPMPSGYDEIEPLLPTLVWP
ncbi:hypothetical protein M0R04_04075 [Candidatus Dojkabacteria bacterium]|jgi:hypothetical protein|nr:hypothetical protein [Candidatus Dojkabacteria bacterium]